MPNKEDTESWYHTEVGEVIHAITFFFLIVKVI